MSITITITMRKFTQAGDAEDKLDRALNGKFSGLKFDVWQHTAQSVTSMCYFGIYDILEGRPYPEPTLIGPRPSPIRSRPLRAVTRSQASDETGTQPGGKPPAETAENVRPNAGSTLVDTAHLPPSTRYPTLPAATSVLWTTDYNISNLEDINNWHRDNRPLFDFMFLSTSGTAGSFLLQFRRMVGLQNISKFHLPT